MEKYCISLDWMQVFCKKAPAALLAEYYTTKGTVTCVLQDYGTNLWQKVYICKYRDREIATVCMCPRNDKMPADGCTIKLANRVLYSHEWLQWLEVLMHEFGVQYVGITRMDICYDCNWLADGRSVPEFLMQYFSHAPYCAGHIVRSGSRKVTINALRSNKGAVSISAMRWGSKGSDIGAYCYNKSLELVEVKDKPWIRETWEKAGLANVWREKEWNALRPKEKDLALKSGDVDDYIDIPVWRFEISIKGHGKDLLDMNSGEIFRIQLSYFTCQNAIENLFYVYAAKVLDFRMSTGQTKIRNYPPLKIFEQDTEVSERPYTVSMLADTGRTEKIVANKLQELSEIYTDVAGVDKQSLENALAFIRAIAGAKAGIVRQAKQLEYISYMKGLYRKDNPLREYIAFVDYCHEERLKMDAQVSFDNWQSLYMEVMDAEMREAKSGFLSDVSPVY